MTFGEIDFATFFSNLPGFSMDSLLNIIFKNWIFKIRAWISNNKKKLFSNIENSYNFFLVSNILEIHLHFFY